MRTLLTTLAALATALTAVALAPAAGAEGECGMTQVIDLGGQAYLGVNYDEFNSGAGVALWTENNGQPGMQRDEQVFSFELNSDCF